MWERYVSPYSEDQRPLVEIMMYNRVVVAIDVVRVVSWDHRKLAPAGADRAGANSGLVRAAAPGRQALAFGAGTPRRGAATAVSGQRRRDTIDSLRSKAMAPGSSSPGRVSITWSAIIPSMTSRPASVRTRVRVQSLKAPIPPVAMSACSAAKSGQVLHPSRVHWWHSLSGISWYAAVAHPDLKDALDVHLHDVRPSQTVLGLEQLVEDGVVEGLRAEQADREGQSPPDLAGLAGSHDARDGGLAAHADQGQAFGAVLHRFDIGQGVGRVGVARSGRGQDLLSGSGQAGNGLPGAAVSLEQGHQGGVDAIVFQAPQQDGRDQTAVLAPVVHLGVGGPGQEDVLADAVHLVGLAFSPEEVAVDLGLPVAKPGAGAGAAGAPS